MQSSIYTCQMGLNRLYNFYNKIIYATEDLELYIFFKSLDKTCILIVFRIKVHVVPVTFVSGSFLLFTA